MMTIFFVITLLMGAFGTFASYNGGMGNYGLWAIFCRLLSMYVMFISAYQLIKTFNLTI